MVDSCLELLLVFEKRDIKLTFERKRASLSSETQAMQDLHSLLIENARCDARISAR